VKDFDPRLYGDRIADRYDEIHADLLDVDACVGFLAGLSRADPILELGVGTGRVAIPLAERGFEVFGIDVSPKMVEVLRRKPGGSAVTTFVCTFHEIEI
jgi:SAM-dependent methyltransferase